jgi:Fic family protein
MWIWQDKNWPQFTYDHIGIFPILEKVIRAVSPLSVLAKNLSQDK